MALEPINILKIVSAVVSVIIAIIAGIIELRLNPDFWLNRWFFLFFMSTSFGFLAYTTYHFITTNADLVIPIMVTGHLFLNYTPICLVMTVFILEKYEKVAMGRNRLLLMLGLFIMMSFGYFVWVPELNPGDYALGIVNTETEPGWFIFVNLSRILLFIYVVYKYAMMAKKVEDDTKKRVQWFFIGVFVIVLGIIINIFGGIADIAIFEILALIAIDIGIISIVKGFLI